MSAMPLPCLDIRSSVFARTGVMSERSNLAVVNQAHSSNMFHVFD